MSSLAGYPILSSRERFGLQQRALLVLCRSPELARMLLYLVIWELLACLLVWRLDVRWPTVIYLPPLSALIWLLPWTAAARRERVRQLLGVRD